jgi:tetratricopeptide (TPR) repeat protein
VSQSLATAFACAIAVATISGLGAAAHAAPAPVTFTREIAPLLFEHCVSCHHPDGPAPFSLATYADARPRARLIAAAAEQRQMPPWKSVVGYGDFIGQRHLSAQEVELIQQWVADGALEGDPHQLPPPPQWNAGWQLGSPDLVVATPEPYVVRASGRDYSRTFVFPIPIDRARYVKGFEFLPGSSNAVHHANIRIDPTPASRRLDDQDPEPGYEGLLLPSAVYPDGFFLGWTPGQVAPLLPKGLAWRWNPGTDLVVEMHFVPMGEPQPVQPSIALYFSDDPPERTPAILRLGRQDIDIPAGERDYATTDSFVLPVDVDVIALQPHAHYRAREVKGTATLPGGGSVPLIFIDDWDYHWQHVYRYRTPVHLPKGTTLSMRITFDNSAANRRNPQQPPAHVQWGQQSTDEMGDLWIQMLTKDEHDRRALEDRIRPKHIADEIVGYETRLRSNPADVSLHNDVALLYKDAGKLDQAIAHFAAVARLQPASDAAHYNLATALLAAGKPSEAIEEYRQALTIKPDYVAAHNNLGSALMKMGSRDEALANFREAIRLDPANSDALYNIGLVSMADGSVSEAIHRFREAVSADGDAIEPLARLAWLLATLPSPSDDAVDEAIRDAGKAAEKTSFEDITVLNVLAAAEATAGQFDRAVATCTAALALGPDQSVATVIRQRQALFAAHRRYILAPSSR